MHALNRSDRAMPAILENHLRGLAGDELESRVMMPCVLLALPNPAPSLMAGAHNTGKLIIDQSPQSAPGQDHSGIWLRNAATGLCLLAAAAAAGGFTPPYP